MHLWTRGRIRWYQAPAAHTDLGNGAGRNRLVELTRTPFYFQHDDDWKFTGESDRQVVLLQLLDLEWFVMQAIADAKIGARDVGRKGMENAQTTNSEKKGERARGRDRERE